MTTGPHNAQLDLDTLVIKQDPDVTQVVQSAQEIRENYSWGRFAISRGYIVHFGIFSVPSHAQIDAEVMVDFTS